MARCRIDRRRRVRHLHRAGVLGVVGSHVEPADRTVDAVALRSFKRTVRRSVRLALRQAGAYTAADAHGARHRRRRRRRQRRGARN